MKMEKPTNACSDISLQSKPDEMTSTQRRDIEKARLQLEDIKLMLARRAMR